MTEARTLRAFTMLELMAASAIAGIVALASVTATVLVQRSFVQQRIFAGLHEQKELLEDYFAPFLRQVGQRSVRPWEAVRTTCAATATTCVDAPVHLLDLQDAPHLKLTDVYDGTARRVSIDVGGGSCPLTPSNGFPSTPHSVIVLPEITSLADGTFRPGWREFLCTPRVGDCTCNLAVPPGDVSAETAAGVPTSGWGRARLARGSTLTIRRAAVGDELVLDRDLDGDGTREAVRLLNEVYGVGVSFGHRADDGTIAFERRIDSARPTALRLLRVEVVLGDVVEGAAGGAIRLDAGPVAGRAGIVYAHANSTVSLPTALGL